MQCPASPLWQPRYHFKWDFGIKKYNNLIDTAYPSKIQSVQSPLLQKKLPEKIRRNFWKKWTTIKYLELKYTMQNFQNNKYIFI
jgi:hypothetical protein